MMFHAFLRLPERSFVAANFFRIFPSSLSTRIFSASLFGADRISEMKFCSSAEAAGVTRMFRRLGQQGVVTAPRSQNDGQESHLQAANVDDLRHIVFGKRAQSAARQPESLWSSGEPFHAA